VPRLARMPQDCCGFGKRARSRYSPVVGAKTDTSAVLALVVLNSVAALSNANVTRPVFAPAIAPRMKPNQNITAPRPVMLAAEAWRPHPIRSREKVENVTNTFVLCIICARSAGRSADWAQERNFEEADALAPPRDLALYYRTPGS
jgi:hypothetical protein